jgi:hypothetical protein
MIKFGSAMEPIKPPDINSYIFAQEQNREAVTIKRFFAERSTLLTPWFEWTLRLCMPYVWLGIRIPHERLLRGYKRPPKKFLGDVDVFGGNLEASSIDEYKSYHAEVTRLFTDGGTREVAPGRVEEAVNLGMIEEGKVKWPPDLSYIAATEVKAAYYNASGDLKAAGDKYNGRDQALELCNMGFDRVALTKIVVTEPIDPESYHPWTVAGVRSGWAMDDYLDDTKGIFVKDDDPYGTILVSNGAILGKLEHMAGSTSAKWLRQPPNNPFRQQAAEVRKVIEENLHEVMSRYPFPRIFPILILACSDDKCGNLYLASSPFNYITGQDSYAKCSQCGKPPK